MNKSVLIKRLVVLSVIFIIFGTVIAANLIDLQIVNGDSYANQAERRLTQYVSVTASRGEILDRYGRPLVTNKMVFSASITYAYWDRTNQNETINSLIEVFDNSTATVQDSLPISLELPLTFTQDLDSSAVTSLRSYLKVDDKAEFTAEIAVELLRTLYGIDDSYSALEARKISGVRYEMVQTQFSMYNTFTIAQDIDIETVTMLKERHLEFLGVDIEVEAVREYNTEYAAHILGYVGPIYKDEYETLKEEGYPMDATIGKTGVEKAFEEYLRGVDGTSAIETNISGNVTSVVSSVDPEPGNNVMLTIDIKLQQVAEESLASTMESIRLAGENSSTGSGADAAGAAAVVIDVNSGEVLALANYPTYSLETFNQDYNELVSDDLNPLLNRALTGTYAPGSTFKMATAVAILEEGAAEPDTTINATGIYTYYASSGYTPYCWAYKQYGVKHGIVNVSDAIKYSCNYYFYEFGRIVTATEIEKYASLLGLGQKTGIELYEASGTLAGPTNREASGGSWYPGDTLGMAIGQSDNLFTPVQIATYIATLVNGGTRYTTHLLKTVKSYDNTETVFENTPEIISSIEISEENITAILEGMGSVVSEGGTAATIFKDYPIAIGGKTGSVELASGTSHGVFVAFAPFDDPEIAVCVVGEHAGTGSNVAPVVRDIFDAYFGSADELDNISQEYTLIR